MDLHPYDPAHHDTTCHYNCHAHMHGLTHGGWLWACQSCLLGLTYALRVNVCS
jgi:hypothetical protein